MVVVSRLRVKTMFIHLICISERDVPAVTTAISSGFRGFSGIPIQYCNINWIFICMDVKQCVWESSCSKLWSWMTSWQIRSENSILLVCDVMSQDKLDILIPEDGVMTLPQNVVNHLPSDLASSQNGTLSHTTAKTSNLTNFNWYPWHITHHIHGC